MIIRLALFVIFLCSNTVYASFEYNIESARNVIKTLQSDILEKIKLSKVELLKTKPDFQQYYREDVLPYLQNVSQNISTDAIHWIDMDFDNKPELVFWTEGLSPSSWGAKEYLFIVKVNGKANLVILEAIDLGNVSRLKNKYKHVRFWKEPNKGKGYNDFLRAVFSCGDFGVSGSSFINLELRWDRYENKVAIYRFTTSFPISIEPATDKAIAKLKTKSGSQRPPAPTPPRQAGSLRAVHR